MQTSNPVSKPRFNVGTTVPADLFVGRRNEIHGLRQALVERSANVLLVGKRKIGKTSLLEKLKQELESERVLSVGVNLFTYHEDPGAFLREILLRVCYEIGNKVFNKSTSELLVSLDSDPAGFEADYRRFHRIYRLTREVSLARSPEPASTAGVLHPLEFVELAEELMAVCHGADYNAAVVLADEANRLAVETSKDILRSYFDVFASKQIQFLFVADPSIVDYKPIEDIFEFTLRLGPFSRKQAVRELIERYYTVQLRAVSSSAYTEDSLETIWDLSKGHPYLMQLLCSRSLEEAEKSAAPGQVQPEHVTQAWMRSLAEDHHLIDFWE